MADSSVCLNASAVEISGFGAPVRTATATGVLATLMPDPSGRSASVDEHAWAAVAPYVSGRASSQPGAVALSSFLPGAGDGAGSNCWALAGTRTVTGKPILAGDPHLAVRNPSIWYEVGLEGPGYKLVGFSFAGIPGIVIGHNDRIAWSLTYAYTDTQDLFVGLERHQQDPGDRKHEEHKDQRERHAPENATSKTFMFHRRPPNLTPGCVRVRATATSS